ncbi:SDR family oxidoreductase [Nocardia inohanensis]|uniref:SDR family oxidoreductase n=1 Tax=Nocardia inohanensis TaxID=209246 RepID=UPI00082B0313|nr:SDR family oxidoreductase [Nocardia inohanensis]
MSARDARLTGKVAVVTGGARGIGAAIARTLIAQGAQVVIGDIDTERLRTTAEQLGISTYRRVDVTDPESFAELLKYAETSCGAVDVLVNNAGIMPVGPLHEETDALSRRMVEINLLGVIYGTKLALRHMLPRGRGHVINISSLAGEGYMPGAATYCASKAAVISFTESARLEYHGSGVQFSYVLPGFINTELIAGTRAPVIGSTEPEKVAAAIVALLRRPRPMVRVPKVVAAASLAQKYLPRSVFGPILRATGLDSMFTTKVDADARRRYLDRISA